MLPRAFAPVAIIEVVVLTLDRFGFCPAWLGPSGARAAPWQGRAARVNQTKGL